MANRSDKFDNWVRKELNDDQVKLLLELEKSVRLFMHVLDTFGTVDEKLVRKMARASRELRMEYERE